MKTSPSAAPKPAAPAAPKPPVTKTILAKTFKVSTPGIYSPNLIAFDLLANQIYTLIAMNEDPMMPISVGRSSFLHTCREYLHARWCGRYSETFISNGIQLPTHWNGMSPKKLEILYAELSVPKQVDKIVDGYLTPVTLSGNVYYPFPGSVDNDHELGEVHHTVIDMDASHQALLRESQGQPILANASIVPGCHRIAAPALNRPNALISVEATSFPSWTAQMRTCPLVFRYLNHWYEACGVKSSDRTPFVGKSPIPGPEPATFAAFNNVDGRLDMLRVPITFHTEVEYSIPSTPMPSSLCSLPLFLNPDVTAAVALADDSLNRDIDDQPLPEEEWPSLGSCADFCRTGRLEPSVDGPVRSASDAAMANPLSRCEWTSVEQNYLFSLLTSLH
jgi:hypothetical protein